MNSIFTYKDSKFWSLVDNIQVGLEWRSSVYSARKLSYFRQRPLDEGKKLNNVSFVLQLDKDYVVAFFGATIRLDNKVDLLFYEAPCVVIEDRSKLTIKATKKFLRNFDKILCQVNGGIWYRDYLVDGNVSYLTTHLLKKGANVTPVFTKVIDLYLDKTKLRKKIRKSYTSLINNGLKDIDPKVITHKEITWEHMISFRDLHISVVGHETRSVESWSKQFKMIQNNEAFIIFGKLDGELVTAGYFSYTKINCIYGSSASRRDLFHKPLFHAIMWTAILHAKKIGCRWFEVGEQNFKKHPTDKIPTRKDLGISDFKAGFGGDTKVYLDVRLNLKNSQLLE